MPYKIYQGTHQGVRRFSSTGSTTTTYIVTGLSNGTTYYFVVSAITLVGEGPVSNEASATPATLPGAPTALTATGGNTQVVLNWAAPASTGGSSVTSYNVYEGTSSGGETFLASASTHVLPATGLTNGTKYYFEVTAVNGVGEGAAPARSRRCRVRRRLRRPPPRPPPRRPPPRDHHHHHDDARTETGLLAGGPGRPRLLFRERKQSRLDLGL